jgi:hypothetical protein
MRVTDSFPKLADVAWGVARDNFARGVRQQFLLRDKA